MASNLWLPFQLAMDTDKGDRILMCTFNHFIQAPGCLQPWPKGTQIYGQRLSLSNIKQELLSFECRALCPGPACACVSTALSEIMVLWQSSHFLMWPPVINKFQRGSAVGCSREMQMKATCCVVEATLFFLAWHESIRSPAFFTLRSPGGCFPEIDASEETSRCREINVVI